MLVIFVDHVPGNPLAEWTPRNFGFSDATEAFIFLSGLALAYAYWPKFAAGETGRVVWRCLRRTSQIYGAHVAICAAVLGIFGAGYLLTGHSDLLGNDGRAQFFASPLASTLGLLTLGYQFGYVNILPVYVALLLMAPMLMVLLRRRLWLGLATSAGLYVAAQAGLHLPSWPWPNTWFLDPFAWQFMFTLGLVVGIAWRGGHCLPRSDVALLAAAAIVLFALFVQTDGFGLVPDLSGGVGLGLPTDKQLLGLARLVHFLSLAYVLTQVDAASRLLRLPGAHEISRLGRHSLTVFSAGSILSAFGQLLLNLCGAIENHLVYDTVGVLFVVAGIVSLVVLAQFLEWKKTRPISHREALPQPGLAAQGLPLPSRFF